MHQSHGLEQQSIHCSVASCQNSNWPLDDEFHSHQGGWAVWEVGCLLQCVAQQQAVLGNLETIELCNVAMVLPHCIGHLDCQLTWVSIPSLHCLLFSICASQKVKLGLLPEHRNAFPWGQWLQIAIPGKWAAVLSMAATLRYFMLVSRLKVLNASLICVIHMLQIF